MTSSLAKTKPGRNAAVQKGDSSPTSGTCPICTAQTGASKISPLPYLSTVAADPSPPKSAPTSHFALLLLCHPESLLPLLSGFQCSAGTLRWWHGLRLQPRSAPPLLLLPESRMTQAAGGPSSPRKSRCRGAGRPPRAPHGGSAGTPGASVSLGHRSPLIKSTSIRSGWM